jgi:hypothetical protein
MKKWPVEYLEFRKQERKRQDERRMSWMGKFAFPAVNTRKTKIMYVDRPEWNFPVPEPITMTEFESTGAYTTFPKIDTVELKKWAYKGKRRICVIRLAYYEKRDILLVHDGSFVCEKRFPY